MKIKLLTLAFAISSFMAFGNNDAEARRRNGKRTHKRTYKRSTHTRIHTRSTRTYKRTRYKAPRHTYKRRVHKRRTVHTRRYKTRTYKRPHKHRNRYYKARRHIRKHRRHQRKIARSIRRAARIISRGVYYRGRRYYRSTRVTLTNQQYRDIVVQVRMGSSPICTLNPVQGRYALQSGQALRLTTYGQYVCYRQIKVKRYGYYRRFIGAWMGTYATYHNQHLSI